MSVRDGSNDYTVVVRYYVVDKNGDMRFLLQ